MEKIVVFTPSLNIGGIERILLTYAKGLAAKGYEVIYLTLSGQGDYEYEPVENLTYSNLGVERLRWAFFDLVKYLRKQKPDIILCANYATMLVYIAKVFSGSSAKIITSQHNYYENYMEMNFKETFIPRYIYPRCFKVIAVSEGIRTMLINDFGIRPQKIVTISNPIDIVQIQSQANQEVELPDEYMLFVGRFDKVKNLPFLIDAFKLFNKTYSQVKLLLVGNGAELENISKYVENAELQEKIEILGVKANPFPYIKNAKIVVLSSISEAFHTILLESLVLGTTIVSTPTYGGIDILEKGKYGYISASTSDVNSFYEKLLQAYLHPFNPEEIIHYAEQNYNLDKKISEIEELWK